MKNYLIFLMLLIVSCSSVAFAKTYTDLPTNHWAYVAINEMTENGILTGYPDGTFAPDKTITRAEFAKILVLALNLQGNSNNVTFNDVNSNHWAYNYINVASNYLSGFSNGTSLLYMPDSVAVREDMAVAVVNAVGLQNSNYDLNTLNKFSDKDSISENLKKYIAIAVENDLMNGNADGTFNPKGGLTRAEVSKLITNAIGKLEKVVINDNGGNNNNTQNNNQNNSTQNNNQNNNTSNNNTTSTYISRDAALQVVLDDLKVDRNSLFDLDLELDREREYANTIYEISFDYNGFEYEYYVDAITGAILNSFKEIDD